MENLIKVIEALSKINSPIDYIIASFLACGLILFIPSYILLAYPSEDIINDCEYMKYTPYFFVVLSSIIGVKFLRWILGLISTPISNIMNKRKVYKARINYLLSLDVVRISIIMRFYDREYNIDRLSNDIVTEELLSHAVINYAPQDEFNWDGKGNYVLNQWVIDEIDKNGEVKKYFLKLLQQRELIKASE